MAKAMPSGLQQDALGRVSGNGGALPQLAATCTLRMRTASYCPIASYHCQITLHQVDTIRNAQDHSGPSGAEHFERRGSGN